MKKIPSDVVKDYSNWNGQGVALWWLGQAGFLIRAGGLNILIDPYISDTLAAKYRGTELPHIRMMPPPIKGRDLTRIDFYICSHAHSDHMDPELIPVVMENNPACLFLCPKAIKSIAQERGAPAERIIGLRANISYRLGNMMELIPIPAAHENLEIDEHGRHKYLGYIIKIGAITLFHPGDCCPYTGLDDHLTNYSIDIAMMPVNGRQLALKEQGIPGNYSLEEAWELCERHDITYMLAHHFGMFEFNTVNPELLKRKICSGDRQDRFFPVEVGICYNLQRRSNDARNTPQR